MRRIGRVAIAFLAGTALLAAAARPHGTRSGASSKDSDGSDRDVFETTIFLYDAVSRVNAGLVANIDAIDTALTAILAGALAALLFTVDKLPGLARLQGTCTMLLFCCSVVTCALGYFTGFWSGIRNRDGVRTRRFVLDVVDQPATAIVGALKDQIEIGEANMTIRLCKRVCALLAIGFLVAGVVMVAMAYWPRSVV